MRTKNKSLVPKFFRDIIAHKGENPGIFPDKASPICRKCGLDAMGARCPYLSYSGPDNPLMTVVIDSPSSREDEAGSLGVHGQAALLKRIFGSFKIDGFDTSMIRWVTLTRCVARQGKMPNLKTKANWCRYFAIQDLNQHPPKLLVPVGTTALGCLSHKSNAGDWGGKILTYRGWPDDWVSNAAFDTGHPVFGPRTDLRVPMYPIQSPRLIYATQNIKVILRWKNQIKRAIQLALKGVPAMQYTKPWYRIETDPEVIVNRLQWLCDNPGTIVTYDTETTGLKPFLDGAKIVFMMFRWVDGDGKPQSIGFPWDYEGSPLKNSIETLSVPVLNALYASRLQGHNLAFDVLFTYGTIPGADLNRLCKAMHSDTWHMLYTLEQKKGGLGLDLVAYDWCKSLAGYEEEMTLLIEKYGDLMNPANGKGGHYANCPPELWDTALKPYVMGDVEVCHTAADAIRDALATTDRYKIPVAHTSKRGTFRYYSPPSRQWVYDNVMRLGNQVLTAVMGRGMYVDAAELSAQEDVFPKQIREARGKIREADLRIGQWCDQNQGTIPGWALDLENKEQLRTLLFKVMGLPIKKVTKAGKKIFGENEDDLKNCSMEELFPYAAVDKFTLNAMCVSNPELRPLQEYRKIYKQYTGFIRPLRNIFAEGVDKKQRKAVPHLMADGCIHSSFLLTATRSGRLGSREPNLQNLPKDGIVKRLFSSRFKKDGCIYQGDLSQIELRLIACACGDASMVEAYEKDIDLHALTQSKIFKRPYEHCTKKYGEWLQKKGRVNESKKLDMERRTSKTANFLTGYGGGAYGLMTALANQGIYLPFEECEKIIESFFDAYPSLRRHIGYYKHFIEANGMAVSFFGRVRNFEEVFGDDKEAKAKALRAGYNHLIQSTASDMMLLSLYTIEQLMRQEGLESMLVSTVHDSLVIDAKRDELPKIHEITTSIINHIPEVMNQLFGGALDTSWCIIPFAGDIAIGNSYYQEVKVSGDNPDWDKLLCS